MLLLFGVDMNLSAQLFYLNPIVCPIWFLKIPLPSCNIIVPDMLIFITFGLNHIYNTVAASISDGHGSDGRSEHG